MGIGTLIIFIAVILVAAIAAAVLLGTGGKLQQTALKTGEETRAAVATGVEVTSIYARDGGTSNNLETFYVMMRLNPGSDPLTLDTAVLKFDTETTTQDLSYNGSVNTYCANTSDGVVAHNCTTTTTYDYNIWCDSANETGNEYCDGQVNSTSNASMFTVEYVKTGPNYQKGYLDKGDFIRAKFNSTNAIGESETIRLKFVPRVGQVTPIEFSTPDVVTQTVVYVYP